MPGFADLADMPEDDRIAVIARACKGLPVGRVIAVCVDSENGKIQRYLRKLQLAIPNLEILEIVENFIPEGSNAPETVAVIKFRRKA